MKGPVEIYSDPNYLHYLVQYDGPASKDMKYLEGVYSYRINNRYIAVSIPVDNDLEGKMQDVTALVYIKPLTLYTLQDISPITAANINQLQIGLPLTLSGKGVVVGMIDTGIDYLNKAFQTDDGKSRIDLIWDQGVEPKDNSVSKIYEASLPYGSIYLNKDIQRAIDAKEEGKDPYEIVPSKDEIGHGTSMAGIIGGNFKREDVKSVVPQCQFAVIKLKEDESAKSKYNINVPIYNITNIMIAVQFLYEYAIKYNVPLVIYLPLGSNFGNHKGNGPLEDFLDNISINRGIVVVTGTGNEGDKEGHTSGIITKTGGFKDIQLYVAPEQKYTRVEIWVDKPNNMSLNLISPSGESTGVIPSAIGTFENYKFVFEKTNVLIRYYIPEEFSGDELILVDMSNLQPGTWIFRLRGENILNGIYNAWIPQRGITVGETRFISSNPYGTVTTPGATDYVITVANYNQNNNNLVNSSGMAFLDDFLGRIDLAAGGINVLSCDKNGGYSTVSGTSVSAAVVAGCCAMLLEWGIVNGNDPDMYSLKMKTYLTRGTTKRPGDIYPNAEWGYGILNMYGVFQNMT